MKNCAFDMKKCCAALSKKNCKGCAFKKTEKQLEKGRKEAEKRIDSLPQSQQEYIYDKYHSEKSGLRFEFAKYGVAALKGANL